MSEKKFLLLLLGYSLLCLFSHLGAFEANLMEARNFVTAREMIADGHWWETTMNGLPRLEKPPLPTWITAIFGSLSPNFSNWFLRFPAALMGLLLTFWTYGLAKEILRNQEQARFSALVAASSLLLIQMAKTGTWDIYFVSFAIGSFMHLYRGLYSSPRKALHFSVAGILLGCSILSKGPVAGIMFIAFLLGLIKMHGIKSLLAEWKFFILAGLLAGLIGFSWPIYNFIYLPNATEAVVAKESITWTTKHVKPFYFYLIFPLYMGIWAIPTILSLIPTLAKKRIGQPYWGLIIWLSVTLFFFSLLPMKKERYLLPIIPLLAIMVGTFLAQLQREENKSLVLKIFWASFGILALALSLSPIGYFIIPKIQAEALNPPAYAGIALLFFIGLAMFFFLKQQKFKNVIALSAGAVLIVNLFLLPTAAALHYKQPHFISPAQHMQHQELQENTLYGSNDPDMRVVHDLKKKLIPISEGKKALEQGPIYLLVTQQEREVQEQFPDCLIERIDSTGHHKTARDYGLISYKITRIKHE